MRFAKQAPWSLLSALGKQLLQELDVESAFEAYKAAVLPPPLDLAACTAKCWETGEVRKGRAVCCVTGITPSKKDLLNCGDAALVRGLLSYALEAYEWAGADLPTTLPREKLMICGLECLRCSWLETAEEAFRLAVELKPQSSA